MNPETRPNSGANEIALPALVRPWEAQSFLERTLRSKLSIARTTIAKADEVIPKLAKAKSYAEAARWEDYRRKAASEEKEALNLLDLYEKELHVTVEQPPGQRHSDTPPTI